MSDNANTDTPSKPKVGSLRDRIAAFENKAQQQSVPGPPPPRPKPAGFSNWKPKQPSPPNSPSKTLPESGGGDGEDKDRDAVRGGMSAADAKDSISKGGQSLRERMAALQGKGAFGASSPPPVAPKPNVERPKWKPPPAVVASPPIGDEDEDKQGDEQAGSTERVISPQPSVKSPPPVRSPTSDVEIVAEDEGVESQDEDPEEEERQRRAAIAARLAKLGGARIGMGPPVFGVKPTPAKKPEEVTSLEPVSSPPAEKPEEQDESKDSSRSPPAAMPVPAAPRRAVPPRRKAPKPSAEEPVSAHDITEQTSETSPSPPKEETPAPNAEEKEQEQEREQEQAQEQEEDAEARKKRIANKLASMGGVNPFAPPPIRRPSSGSVDFTSPPTSPPLPAKKPSLRKSSTGSIEAIPPPRRSSVGSIKAMESIVTEEPESVHDTAIPEEEEEAMKETKHVGEEREEPIKKQSQEVSKEPPQEKEVDVASATSPGPTKVSDNVPTATTSIKSEAEPEPSKNNPEDAVEQPVKKRSDGELEAPAKNEVEEPGKKKIQTSQGSPRLPQVEKKEKVSLDDDETRAKPEEKSSGVVEEGNQEQDEYDIKETTVDSHYHESDDDNDYDVDRTPQPPPQVISEAFMRGRSTRESYTQEEERGRKSFEDNELIANASEGISVTSPHNIVQPQQQTQTRPRPDFPRRIVQQQSRSTSYDTLSVPALPRRVVPQTPEVSGDEDDDNDEDGYGGYGGDNDNDEGDEGDDGGNSELEKSTLFVPPPRNQTQVQVESQNPITQVSQIPLRGLDIDDGEESETPLRVPPRTKPFIQDDKDKDTDTESNAPLPVPLPIRKDSELGRSEREIFGYSPAVSERSLDDMDEEGDVGRRISGSAGTGMTATMVSSPLARPSRAIPNPPPPQTQTRVLADSGSDYADEAEVEVEHERQREFERDLEQEQEREEVNKLSIQPSTNAVPIIVRPRDDNEEPTPVPPPHSSSSPSVPPITSTTTSYWNSKPPPMRNLPSPPQALPRRIPHIPVPIYVQDRDRGSYGDDEEVEGEVLDEEEGDPIDPAFHSPSRRTSTILPSQPNTGSSHGFGHNGTNRNALSPMSTTLPKPVPPQGIEEPLPVPVPVSVEVEDSEENADAEVDDEEKEVIKKEKEKEEGEEVPERSQRSTIAERMAKLGGIKFGAAPLGMGIGRAPVLPVKKRVVDVDDESREDNETELQVGGETEKDDREEREGGVRGGNRGRGRVEDDNEEDEEEERARRERIAAKLSGMGGMRIGMMPMGMGMGGMKQKSHILKDETDEEKEVTPIQSPKLPPPPKRVVPPPQPTSTSMYESGSDKESLENSDDGVKVEAEESEIEDVGYVDVKNQEEEEETPPPVPVRVPRSSSNSTTTSPVIRPPVPMGFPFRKASGGSVKGSGFAPQQQQHSEYVMVEEPRTIAEEDPGTETEEEEVPPPPPARPANHRGPPGRVPPTIPSSSIDSTSTNLGMKTVSDSISSQWELPAIPSSSLDIGSGTGDLSMSWSEACLDDSNQIEPVPVPPPSSTSTLKSPEALHLTTDDLMVMWGRVGVHIHEAATSLLNKSKTALVGDGTYRGFVNAVLKEVPNASCPPLTQPVIPYGYLVYLQSGAAVQKRASEIMPGDVVEFVDARFKGHKGLHGYSLHVGGEGDNGVPLVGVIGEFEPKKSKIRVFQANQRVGQQTVETVSYRLDDLKSGLVKVYRVLEA